MADSGPDTPGEWVEWFRHTDETVVVYLRDVLGAVGGVLFVGLLLFAVSGLWPPMVAVTSESMEPHMERGDLVFVMEEHRLEPGSAHADTGVVPYRTAEQTGYRRFGAPGDVVVFHRNGDRAGTPVIHRARFWVNESENWVANGKADPDHLGSAVSCGGTDQCPAPHAGFVTKGDNTATNSRYDQVSGVSGVVKPTWIVGTAEFQVPWLGNVRLWVEERALAAPTGRPEVAASDDAGTGPPRCGWAYP